MAKWFLIGIAVVVGFALVRRNGVQRHVAPRLQGVVDNARDGASGFITETARSIDDGISNIVREVVERAEHGPAAFQRATTRTVDGLVPFPDTPNAFPVP